MTRKTTKIADRLRTMKIYNTHGFLSAFGEKNDVAVSFRGADNGRGGRGAYAHVWSPHFKTNPKSHWQDYGNQWFGGRRDKSLPAAFAWAEQNYGIKEWAPCPISRGCYVPKHTIEKMKAALIAAPDEEMPPR